MFQLNHGEKETKKKDLQLYAYVFMFSVSSDFWSSLFSGWCKLSLLLTKSIPSTSFLSWSIL